MKTERPTAKFLVIAPRVGKMRAAYKTTDGRFEVRPFDNCIAGRGAAVPEGWLVTDTLTGEGWRWALSLRDLKEYLADGFNAPTA